MMKETYCITWNKYRKLKRPKTSCIFNKTVFSIIYESAVVMMIKYLRKKNHNIKTSWFI